MGRLNCYKCGKPFNECDSMRPIDPKGVFNRRWVCNVCEGKPPETLESILDKVRENSFG